MDSPLKSMETLDMNPNVESPYQNKQTNYMDTDRTLLTKTNEDLDENDDQIEQKIIN